MGLVIAIDVFYAFNWANKFIIGWFLLILATLQSKTGVLSALPNLKDISFLWFWGAL